MDHLEGRRLPNGKVLIPGVLDTTTTSSSSPSWSRSGSPGFAGLVGRENVIAGTDCGFGTFAGFYSVRPRVRPGWSRRARRRRGDRGDICERGARR